MAFIFLYQRVHGDDKVSLHVLQAVPLRPSLCAETSKKDSTNFPNKHTWGIVVILSGLLMSLYKLSMWPWISEAPPKRTRNCKKFNFSLRVSGNEALLHFGIKINKQCVKLWSIIMAFHRTSQHRNNIPFYYFVYLGTLKALGTVSYNQRLAFTTKFHALAWHKNTVQ